MLELVLDVGVVVTVLVLVVDTVADFVTDVVSVDGEAVVVVGSTLTVLLTLSV